MFGIGIAELLIILIVALLLFGADRLPGIANAMGRAVNEFKKGMQGDGVSSDNKKNSETK